MKAAVLREVTTVYKTRGGDVVALDGVSLSVERGEVVVLMGPSGSGKTTLLNIVSTLDRPTSGEVYILDRDITHMGERELEKFRLRNVGFLFQTFNLVPYLTAEQNVALPLVALGVRRELAYMRARLLLEMVGLGGVGGLYPGQLSGGMQQRVAFARAMAADPPLLILDEPTSNVDVDNASLLLSLIAAVNKTMRTTIFIATHDPDVTAIATRLIYLRGGRLREGEEPPRRELAIDVERVASIYEKLKLLHELG